MINGIQIVENKTGGYPRWIDYKDEGVSNSIRVDNETEKAKVLNEIFEIKKLQIQNKIINTNKIVYRKR